MSRLTIPLITFLFAFFAFSIAPSAIFAESNVENGNPSVGTIETKLQPAANEPVPNGGVLPKTATSYPLMIVIGAALLLIGFILYLKNNKSK